jgi:hypothetical protein
MSQSRTAFLAKLQSTTKADARRWLNEHEQRQEQALRDWGSACQTQSLDKAISALAKIDRRERMRALMFWARAWPQSQLAELVTLVWQDTEFPHKYGPGRVVTLFNLAGAPFTDGPALPTEPITIYRGVLEPYGTPRGVSWTQSYGRALWFANRFSAVGGNPLVYQATVTPDGILAVFDGRREDEVVVNPHRLRNLRLARKRRVKAVPQPAMPLLP